jgi:hypothetical protein
MLKVTSITPAGGTNENPTVIQISDDPNLADANPSKISVEYQYSNPTSGLVYIFIEGEGSQVVTGSFPYDSDNDPLTNPGAKPRDGSANSYLYRYQPGTVSNLELYIQQAGIDGSFGAIVERVSIPGSIYTREALPLHLILIPYLVPARN